MKFKAKL